MPNRIEFDASRMNARRYLETDNTLSRYLLSFTDESGNAHIIRVPTTVFETVVSRYAEEEIKTTLGEVLPAVAQLHSDVRNTGDRFLNSMRARFGIRSTDLRTYPEATETVTASAT